MNGYDVKELIAKWKPILEHENAPKITDPYKLQCTAVLLENQQKDYSEMARQSGGRAPTLLGEAGVPLNQMGGSAAPSTSPAGNIDIYDPVLISLVRRSAPNLIAYDLCGVQPMTGPTGLIFAMRSMYANSSAFTDEAFYNEANTLFSTVRAANNTLGENHTGSTPSGNAATYNFAGGMTTAQAEALGSTSNVAFAQMGFTIEKVAVTAKSRALKAEYTMELAQDLKAIHGLDAEAELSNILSTEILAEINREIVRTINLTAKTGAQVNTTTAGTFDLDVDSNGRWMVEKFKGLMFQIEREQNQIAKETRRGKGNFLLCSSDVASALQMAGVLDYTPALNSNNLAVDDTGATFAGVLNGRTRVYIDPYFGGTTTQYMTIGYKGSSAFDAGLFYCPYVPLQMVRAVGEQEFQPKIGFKTRYGVVANPFAEGLTQGDGRLLQNSNVYYRRVLVTNLM